MVRDSEVESAGEDPSRHDSSFGLLLGPQADVFVQSSRRNAWRSVAVAIALATACAGCFVLIIAYTKSSRAVDAPVVLRRLTVEKAISVSDEGDGPFRGGEVIDIMDNLHVASQKWVEKDGYIELMNSSNLVLTVENKDHTPAKKPFKRGMGVRLSKKESPIIDAQHWEMQNGKIRLASTSTIVLSAYTMHAGKDTRRLHIWMDCNVSRKKIPMHTRECSFHNPLQTFIHKDNEFILVGTVPEQSAAGSSSGNAMGLILCIASAMYWSRLL